jgi:AcrR family transcriptional regulator
MSPRKYDMSNRSAAVDETRRRIVEATMALHDAQGVRATSFQDIADRAGVALGTVYRHFPTLDELIPACGEQAMARLALPDAAACREVFAGTRSREERLRRLVRETFGIYERGAAMVEAVRVEGEVHPMIAAAHVEIEAALDRLVSRAVADRSGRRLARALVDVRVWRALAEQGITGDKAVSTVAEMLESRTGAEHARAA